MKKPATLKMIAPILIGFISNSLIAQTNMINLDDLSAYHSSSSITHQTKVNDPDHFNIDHDTIKYMVVSNPGDHLGTSENLNTDHQASETTLKYNLVSAINHISANYSILFDYNRSRLTDGSKKTLDKVAEVILQHPKALFELGAHTDARGVYADNMVLSQKRVDAAIKYLIEKGVNREQLIGVAYGEAELKNVCDSDSRCSEEVHAGNRRIEIKILSLGN